MPIITAPIRPNDSGPAVADLQYALLKFGAPIAEAEKNAQRFGDSTLAAVIAFRNQHGLPAPARGAAPLGKEKRGKKGAKHEWHLLKQFFGDPDLARSAGAGWGAARSIAPS